MTAVTTDARAAAEPPARVLLATFGSLGDLHPFVALALALRARGHVPVIATHEPHRAKVEAEGIAFAPMRPDPNALRDDPTAMRRVWGPLSGPAFLLRDLVMGHLRESFEDLDAAADGCDLVVSHPITPAAPLVAQRRRLPWVSVLLAPSSLLSAHDPPAPAGLAWLAGGRVPASLARAALMPARAVARRWSRPVAALRAELGLPPSRAVPLLEGQFSPTLNLALFSPLLASPQPDWPVGTIVTGFPWHDAPGDGSGLGGRFDAATRAALEAFLAAGAPPIVFTLGSVAVLDARDFWTEAIACARRLGRRALLLVGAGTGAALPAPLPDGIAAFEYVPHSVAFPAGCAIVHQGGIGTTAQALRSGRPSLVVPFGFDQPDNARRCRRLGVAAVLPRGRFRADRAASALGRLLADDALAARCASVASRVAAEDGARVAADALSAVLARTGGRGAGGGRAAPPSGTG
jgi:UDP:flavonoid glycosyltransferase YjiC (YdhE family)